MSETIKRVASSEAPFGTALMRTVQRSCKNDKVNIEDDRNYRLFTVPRKSLVSQQKCVSMCARVCAVYYLSHCLLEVGRHFMHELKRYQTHPESERLQDEIPSNASWQETPPLAIPSLRSTLCFPQWMPFT